RLAGARQHFQTEGESRSPEGRPYLAAHESTEEQEAADVRGRRAGLDADRAARDQEGRAQEHARDQKLVERLSDAVDALERVAPEGPQLLAGDGERCANLGHQNGTRLPPPRG